MNSAFRIPHSALGKTWLDEIVKAGGVFITGTDTGVGKTVVTAAIGQRLQRMGVRVGAFKPISTGGLMSEDGKCLKAALRLLEPSSCVAPVNFIAPVAPLVAVAMAQRKLSWGKIRGGYRWWRRRYPVVLLEGVGGVMVPVDRGKFVVDLIREFRLPTIIVARAGLGTINHTVLTVQALQRKRLKILGVILNGTTGKDVSEKTNGLVIEACTGIPILATLAFQSRWKGK